jgi:hypothetical protein
MPQLKVVLGFGPWISFWILRFGVSFQVAAVAALVFSMGINAAAWRGQRLKILEMGTLVYFLMLTLLFSLSEGVWLQDWINVVRNGSLALIVAISLLLQRPFTLQYAREQVPSDYWHEPLFMRINVVLTVAWLGMFLTQTLAAGLARIWPEWGILLNLGIPLVTYVGAFWFTGWYPDWATDKAED